MTPRAREAVEAFKKTGSLHGAARELGVDRNTVRDHMDRSGHGHEWRERFKNEALNAAGYDLTPREKPKGDAWDRHVAAFEAKVSNQLARNDRVIKRDGPFVLFHCTDQHVDDDAAALNLLRDDIAASHDMGAIMCHGGDLLNNWPMGGKLAKQWAEQTCTRPEALERAQIFIEKFRPDVWVDGNHEEMNPYLVDLFSQWLPDGILRDYWRCDFTVTVRGGRDCRVALAHKFMKGSSWFHGAHGHLREMLQGDERDVYMDGHFHQSATMHHTLPERGHTALLVASAGYKVLDKWATRISRGGKRPTVLGRAHWIVVDPFADHAAYMATAYACPRQAAAALNGLQNLRAV